MKNFSKLNHLQLTPGFVIGLFILLAINFLGLINSIYDITDFFHQGEYFASFASFFNKQVSQNYLTIHGALDYIPAWLSFNIYGPNNYFFGTVFLYALANLLAAGIFYVLVAICTERLAAHYQAIVLIIAAIASSMLVSYRDILLLISLLLYFSCQLQLQPLVKSSLEIILGVFIALNMFWSFDRGVVGIISIGMACLLMSYRDKLYLKTFISFFLCLFTLSYFIERLSLQHYIENIIFILNTSSQWSYGFELQAITETITLIILCAFCLFILYKSVINNKNLSNASIANSLVLGMLTLFFLKLGTNRADIMHIRWSMWPAALAFLYAQHNNQSLCVTEKKDSFSENLFSVIKNTGRSNLGFIVFFLALLAPISLADLNLLYKSIIQPRSNTEFVSEGVNWASSELLRTKTNCVFDLANNGVINGIAALPACTRFIYPAYANKNYENEIIESLISQKPAVIIYYSDNWSFNIDNKNMHKRFPKLKAYLDKTYLFQSCKFEYCLRYLDKN